MRIASITLTLLLILCASVQAQQQKTQQRTTAQRRSMTPSEIAQKAFPSIVEVITEKADGSPGVLGSGFFVKPDLIATNFHVIRGASEIWAKVIGGKSYFTVEFISGSEETDLALLKVDGVTGRALPLGNDRNVKVGDDVYAVGNPKGFEGTFSQGIVSALRGDGYVQITAPISPGSSGGPILNKRGEVIGVAALTANGGQNLNFAISVSYLAALVKDVPIVLDSPIIWENPTPDPKGKSAKELFDEGKRILYSSGGYSSESTAQASRPYFEEALRKKPDYAEAWFELGNCYKTHVMLLEAAEKYIQAIRVNPSYFEAHRGLGFIYLAHALSQSNSSDAIPFYQKAVLSLEKATLIKPDDPKTFINLGFALYKSGQRSKAEMAFSKAQQLSTDDPYILLSLDTTYKALGLYQEEIGVLTQYVQVKPNDSLGYNRLGIAYRDLGLSSADRQSAGYQFEKALESFRKAHQFAFPFDTYRPSSEVYMRYQLGLTYLAMRDKNSAIKEYETIKELESSKSYLKLRILPSEEGKSFAELLFREIYK